MSLANDILLNIEKVDTRSQSILGEMSPTQIAQALQDEEWIDILNKADLRKRISE